MPPLDRENETPLSLFVLVKDQNIMADGVPVALNLATARAEINRVVKDPEDQDECLRRIMAAHANMVKSITERRQQAIEDAKS